jgi:transcriptional regulator with XRE-family HTH domain
MAAKNPFSKAQQELLLRTVKKHRTRFKNQEELALALGISQPSLSNMLRGKWAPGVTVARAIAHLDGTTLESLIGEFGEPTQGTRTAAAAGAGYPNLATCVDFYRATREWPRWVIAAAEAGYFGPTDVAPPEWAARLDELAAKLRRK